ncbi:LacI family DNA-binding transcriptional regulator [Nonomuraea basaltis]|uniref:LacI family DNA-binding transcriptional regulator n=1 Tax=Nonomuraea basaltis TaxID=2495887 RepID=UPI001F0E7FBA|nr:LacI family DNA-binding transcriptional regulator [Nonomuraea basaltis]
MSRTPARSEGKRPTLADVAARADVSTALVSIIMRGAKGASAGTRERVLRAAKEIGYRPDARARLLRSNRSRLLGVQFGLQHPFHTDLVEGIYAAAEPAGYQVALSAVAVGRSERHAVETLLADRCEALILLGPQAPAAQLAELATQLPVVSVARRLRGTTAEVDVVRTADDEGARQAVDHLVALGHRDIAHIDGGRAPGAADRRRGYRTTMSRHGLTRHIRIVPGGLTEEDGAAAARALLDGRPRPTAILVFNDRCATGVLDMFLRAGLPVPGEISVVGFDNSHLARLAHIDLTTVGQDIPRLASLAVGRAIARLEGEQVAEREIVIAPRLVVRGTTAASPGVPGVGRPRVAAGPVTADDR